MAKKGSGFDLFGGFDPLGDAISGATAAGSANLTADFIVGGSKAEPPSMVTILAIGAAAFAAAWLLTRRG